MITFKKPAMSVIAVAALLACASSTSFAAITTYTLSNASWNDGSSFTGSWSIDWTVDGDGKMRGAMVDYTLINGGGVVSGPNGGPSGAYTFTMANFNGLWNVTGNLWELNSFATTSEGGMPYLNLDFDSETGDLYVGSSSQGSNLDITNRSDYVSIRQGEGNPGQTDVVPEPGTVALLGLGAIGFAGFRKRRSMARNSH